MKKLIAIAALGAILLFSMSSAVFAGDQEGPVFEPRPTPPYSQPLAQGTQILSPGEDVWQPLNPDIRG